MTARNSHGLSASIKGQAACDPPSHPVFAPEAALRPDEVKVLPAAAPSVRTDEVAPASLFARQVRMAFDLLRTAIEEAGETVECNNVKMAEELESLQARALRSIQDSALATIDLFEAIGAAQTPGELASRQMELARRQRETVQKTVTATVNATVNARLGDFFDSARSMVAMMTDPLNRQMRALSVAISSERGPSEAGDSILSRLNKLTARQKRVLQLLAEGLPNKVIAHELGISETTVKAHVGEILRKLKVYNRARAIVMLAQFDMSQIRDLAAGEGAAAE